MRELYPRSDHRLLAKLVPNFGDRELQVVSVTDPSGRNLGFLDREEFKCLQNIALEPLFKNYRNTLYLFIHR
jgi:hypothetical protein